MIRILAILTSILIPSGIPDFSKVGYRNSDDPIPEYENVVVLEAPAGGTDATEMIQTAIDEFKGRGAILLKAGTYNISGSIHIDKSNLVLRGEGDSTILFATGKSRRTLIRLGHDVERRFGRRKTHVEGDSIPVGTCSLEISGRNRLKPGDKIVVTWEPSQKWISDLRMDRIPPRKDGLPVRPWTPGEYVKNWERTVVSVNGNHVTLDNPLVMQLEKKYGEYFIRSYSYRKSVRESGIENLRMISGYESEEDEEHSWTAVDVSAAEHCWVRNVNASYFCFCCVHLRWGSRNITVDSCSFTHPKAKTAGSRKYAFYIDKGQKCLVSNCTAVATRHAFATADCTCGPNVFLNCTETDGKGDCGPHMRWASGVLYDNVRTDAMLRVQDRSNLGPGHGWAGVTHVFWNCEATRLVCQNPWISGKNYCIGCVGTKHIGNFKGKPDGEWISHGERVLPESLYYYQLSQRRDKKQ
jgi:hypothetical protein